MPATIATNSPLTSPWPSGTASTLRHARTTVTANTSQLTAKAMRLLPRTARRYDAGSPAAAMSRISSQHGRMRAASVRPAETRESRRCARVRPPPATPRLTGTVSNTTVRQQAAGRTTRPRPTGRVGWEPRRARGRGGCWERRRSRNVPASPTLPASHGAGHAADRTRKLSRRPRWNS